MLRAGRYSGLGGTVRGALAFGKSAHHALSVRVLLGWRAPYGDPKTRQLSTPPQPLNNKRTPLTLQRFLLASDDGLRYSLGMEHMLERAIEIAARAHAGQVDKAGAPYILHPLRVMAGVGDDLAARTVAVLHDVVEDCPDFPIDRLVVAGFPQTVTDALIALTRRSDETYAAFIDRIALNPLATKVKLADLRDNMNLDRFANPTRADLERVRTRYAPARAKLLAA